MAAITKMKVFYFCYFLLDYHVSFGQEIEYYPSQSILDTYYYAIGKKEIDSGVFPSSKIYGSIDKNINYRLINTIENYNHIKVKRSIDTTWHGHPKTREELWNERFLSMGNAFDKTSSLIKLLYNITINYLKDCTPIILYDNEVKSKESYFLENLLADFPTTYIHGYITDEGDLVEPKLLRATSECLHYIIFLANVTTSAKILGKQSENKVVIVARSSQWALQEFLSGPLSRTFVNLLVIGQSFKEEDDTSLEAPYILYTHKLYTDGLGASKPVVLNSWIHGKYSRDVNLFPHKMIEGYASHRFTVSVANQPPFVFRRIKSNIDGSPQVVWDGVEIRLVQLLAKRNNFTVEIVEPQEQNLGSGDAVTNEIAMARADIGIAGMYVTSERLRDIDVSYSHSQDCAVFITLMSTALPRYRAILGPFHWHVWVALTFTYLFGMFPLAFSDKHTLRHLINNSGEMENMFWYVFGTFTNCFTFLSKNSWSKTTKITTRLLIGWYWIFTIIITSCYTGSIIAFVTLPIFPETVDSIEQLLAGFYRIGTLDHGGWERWFFNSSDMLTNKLLKKVEFVPNVETGIRNITKAFFWPYAFLGSRAEFEYITQANFSKAKSKRAILHISNECFVPFGVTIGFPRNSVYSAKLSNDITRIYQSGLIDKITDEVRFEIKRSNSGKLLAVVEGNLKTVSVVEKGLTLEDTQGMFLLLGAGFLIAATALLSEWMGGFTKKCRCKKNTDIPSSVSTREKLISTPKTDDGDEVKIIDDTESILHFGSRPTTVSSDTLEGNDINVSQESIVVHNNYNNSSDLRSSSIDVDREVQEIFERDEKRRRIHS